MWMYCSGKVIGFPIVPLTYCRETPCRLVQAFGTGGRSLHILRANKRDWLFSYSTHRHLMPLAFPWAYVQQIKHNGGQEISALA